MKDRSHSEIIKLDEKKENGCYERESDDDFI